jgi:hypothetical protein
MTLLRWMILRRLMRAYWPGPRVFINPQAPVVNGMIQMDPTCTVYRNWPGFPADTIIGS